MGQGAGRGRGRPRHRRRRSCRRGRAIPSARSRRCRSIARSNSSPSMKSSFAPTLSAATCSPIGSSMPRVGRDDAHGRGDRRLADPSGLCPRPRSSSASASPSSRTPVPKKLTRLPRRSAIVAFSADAVYASPSSSVANAEGPPLSMGSLSPRTRNAQVNLFQSGEVDFLVATDAIGMGSTWTSTMSLSRVDASLTAGACAGSIRRDRSDRRACRPLPQGWRVRRHRRRARARSAMSSRRSKATYARRSWPRNGAITDSSSSRFRGSCARCARRPRRP